ncbi:guanylate kinase [Azospirillaceae bacterium]
MVTQAWPDEQRRGVLLVLSSPSGAGKTTLSRRLLAGEPDLTLSISVTTRAPRPAEVHGRDYFFVERAVFDRMVANGEFLECAEVFGNGYGTPRAPVEEALAAGRDVLFDIDWQGHKQIGETAPDDRVGVFILPPSGVELERRLCNRGQDAPEVIARRMAKAADESSHWTEYDYVIVNRDFEESFAGLCAILRAERLRRRRRLGLDALLKDISGYAK